MIQTLCDLSCLNTLRLPAIADAFARYASVSDLLDLLHCADEHCWPVRVLGGGSNVLMTEHISGLVVQSAMTSIALLSQNKDVSRVSVDAGMNWHDWVQQSTEYGYGLENLALIPGTVGAAPVQNIGAYGVEVANFLESVTGIQLSTRQWRTLSADECRFGYRDSVFKREFTRDFIVTRVVFCLPRDFSPDLSYGPLKQWAGSVAGGVTSASLIDEVCRIRRMKLPDPADTPNAGSFFKNPLISAAQAGALLSRYPQMPTYPQLSGDVKVAAGWLIEQAGWKGRWQQHAGMHDQQALVLVTDGQADYLDIDALRQQIERDVNDRFGIVLEAEPQPF